MTIRLRSTGWATNVKNVRCSSWVKDFHNSRMDVGLRTRRMTQGRLSNGNSQLYQFATRKSIQTILRDIQTTNSMRIVSDFIYVGTHSGGLVCTRVLISVYPFSKSYENVFLIYCFFGPWILRVPSNSNTCKNLRLL